MDERAWLGRVPAMRWERHYGDRVVRCFVERPGNAYDLLAEAAARNPDGEALVCGAERLSYRELEDAVARCAAGLAAAGIAPGDRVAMLLGNGVAFPVVHVRGAAPRRDRGAALGARADPGARLHAGAIRGAKLLVHDADLADRLPASRRRHARARRGRAGRALRLRCRCWRRRAVPRRPPCTRRIRRSSSTPRGPPGGRKARC